LLDTSVSIRASHGPGARSIRLKLPRFTIIGATTRLALMTAPLRSRFGAVYRLDFYDETAMQSIVERSAAILGIGIEDGGVAEIARRARGTPRVANRLLKRVRDYAQVRADGTITKQTVTAALALEGIDELGLTRLDHRYLKTIIEFYHGGPVGIEAIAATLQEETDTLVDVVEPFLLKTGLVIRTSSGRRASEKAYKHLGFKLQKRLF